MNHHIYRDPLKAIGNAEDPRVTDPDEVPASLVGLNRGILKSLQDIGSGGGGGGGGEVGGATAANQVVGNDSLSSIDTKLDAQATAANQAAANALLTSIDTKVGTAPPGGTTAANQTATHAPVAPAAATATKSQLAGGQYNAAAPVMTDGQQASLQLGSNGQLLIGVMTSTTGLGKAEDSVHASGSTGIMSLGVRQDVAASLAGTDGDYTPPIMDSLGRQWVRVGAVDDAVAAAALSNIASAITSTQVVAANAARKGLLLVNDDANVCYVKYGTAASATSYTVALVTGAYWEMPRPTYTGIIHAIWAGDGAGSLRVTEL
jgi:hypothetical protein